MNTQHTITIDITVPHALLKDSAIHSEEILAGISEEETKRIQDYVVDQLADRDGAPELIDMQISKFQYDDGSCTGTFRLHFKISRRFCCSDSTGCNDDYMDFRFAYLEGTVHAEGHYFQWNLNN